MNWKQIIEQIQAGNAKTLARAISTVENGVEGYQELMMQLPPSDKKIIGITGPPGAGKSTLVDAMIAEFIKQDQRTGILCVDPSSPFSRGALLGDRIRMSEWYNHPNIFIRSLATRGSLGGLNPMIMEISDLLKAAPFDHIIIETVGAGQNEVEIASLADTVVVVLIPQAGDEVQTMKAGLMEIADIFVVNKADMPGADIFVRNLHYVITPASRKTHKEIPVIKTIASERKGVVELTEEIIHHQQQNITDDKKYWLLAEKAFLLISQKRMIDVNRKELEMSIKAAYNDTGFNLYDYIYSKY